MAPIPAAGVKSHLFRLGVAPMGVMPAAMLVAVLRGVSHLVELRTDWPPVCPSSRFFLRLCCVSLSSHSEAVSCCDLSRSLSSVVDSALILPSFLRSNGLATWLLMVTLGSPTLVSSSKVLFVMTPFCCVSFSSSNRSSLGRLASGSWKSGSVFGVNSPCLNLLSFWAFLRSLIAS